MSEPNGANGNGYRRPASISGPERRQDFLRGNLPECRKRVRVEADVSTSEPLGEVKIIESSEGRIVLAGPVTPSLFAGSHAEADNSSACIELHLAVTRWRIASLTPLEAAEDGTPRTEATLTFQAILWGDGTRTDEWDFLRQITFRGPIDEMRNSITKLLMAGAEFEAHSRHTVREYFGTLTINPNRQNASGIELARITSLWKKDHPGEEMTEAVEFELAARAEAGILVEGFDDFIEDAGPIPPTLDGGALNVDGLVRILSIKSFREPLTQLYRKAREDVETWGFFQGSAPRSSPGISNTLPTSEASPPS